MPRPKRLPAELPRQRVLAALKRMGFYIAREGDRHTVLKHPDRTGAALALPRHSRISRKLLLRALTAFGFAEEDFSRHY